MELVLHPGHSKCGSTTIQDFLYLNRAKFRDREVVFPDCNFKFPYESDYQFHLTQTPRDYFAKIQNGTVPLTDLEHKLDELLEKGEHLYRRVIISAENLINGIANTITKDIHECFAKRFSSVRVVYYVRRPDEFLISSWQQWSHKTGQSLDNYLQESIETGLPNYNGISNVLARVYGKKNLRVGVIYPEHLHKNSLMNDFCFKASIMEQGLNFELPNSNIGLSTAICESLSRISHVYEDIHDQNVKSLLISNAENSVGLLRKKYNNLSNRTRLQLFEKFNAQNIKLLARHMPGIEPQDSGMLFSEVSKDGITDSEKIDLLADEVDKLQDLCAVQFDMLIKVVKELRDLKD